MFMKAWVATCLPPPTGNKQSTDIMKYYHVKYGGLWQRLPTGTYPCSIFGCQVSPNRVTKVPDRQGCSIIHSPLPFIRSATSFSLSSPLPVTQIMLPLSISSAEMQESHTKLWTWKARQKNNNKDNRSPRVSECFSARERIFPLYMRMYVYLRCHLDVLLGWLSCFAFCIYLCLPACRWRYETFDVCSCRKTLFSMFTDRHLLVYLQACTAVKCCCQVIQNFG